MAAALAKLLRFKGNKNSIRLSEINLDDNGLKDNSFALILEAIAAN